MQPVFIKQEILEAIIQHAVEEAPLECCGLLMGSDETVTHVRRMTNVSRSPKHYSIAPQALFHFFKDLRALKLRHLGIYHSHPASEAYPSKIDLEESYYPECSYIIVSLKNADSPSVRAFSLADGSIQERELQVFE